MLVLRQQTIGMAVTNLRKAIFYLQQAIREADDGAKDLLEALNTLVEKEKQQDETL